MFLSTLYLSISRSLDGGRAFSTIEIWFCVFQSREFHPCALVPCFPFLLFPPVRFGPVFSSPVFSTLRFGPTFSSPAFSTPVFFMVPRFPVPRFQRPQAGTVSKLMDRSSWLMARRIHYCIMKAVIGVFKLTTLRCKILSQTMDFISSRNVDRRNVFVKLVRQRWTLSVIIK